MTNDQDIATLAIAESESPEHSRLRRTVLEALDEGVLVVGVDGRLMDANPAACGMLGLELCAARADPEWWSAFNARQRADGTPLAVGADVLASGIGVHDVEIELNRPGCAPMWLTANYLPLRAQDGTVSGLVLAFRDVTDKELAQRELTRSRNYLRAVTDSVGEGLFTIDSDGNVAYMNASAERLFGFSFSEVQGRSMHRLVHGHRPDGSTLAAEDCRIQRACVSGETIHSEEEVFTHRDGRLLEVAYTAAPFATDEGIQGCAVVFEDISERRAREREVQHDLAALAGIERVQRALQHERFVLHAQPIIEASTGRVVQRELLLRVHECDGQIVGPAGYLPVAERFGLIGDIDRWVIQQSCEIAASGLPVELNLSAHSVGSPAILDHIERCLARAKADPTLMVFEITETALVENQQAAQTFAEHLHRLGCSLALDDFGTGYGSFTYLKQLAVDYLKIDIEFVRDLTENAASRHVVKAVVAIAASFDLKTIGEGVEDAETLDMLGELGVDFAQGFHIGRPAPLETSPGSAAAARLRRARRRSERPFRSEAGNLSSSGG